MQMILAALIIVTSFAHADSNLLENFKLQHCSEGECLRAEGEKGYVSMGGRMISAGHVTMTVVHGGRRQSFECTDFHADLIVNRYFCEGKKSSYTVDANLLVKAY